MGKICRSLRLLGSVGEPINPAAWEWYHRVIGKDRCPIVDTWWQTETGAIMIAPMPGAVPLKPGSGTLPMPGVILDVVDLAGKPVGDESRRISDHQTAMAEHGSNDLGRSGAIQGAVLDPLPGAYFTGDAARRDEDGYYWVLGRVDDVMNVSGHRLSTMEVESALVRHPLVAEAAVVGKPHEITGQAVCCFVTLKRGDTTTTTWQGTAAVGRARDRQRSPVRRRSGLPKRCRRHAAGKSCGGCCGRS